MLEMHNLLTGKFQEIHSYFSLSDYTEKTGFQIAIDESFLKLRMFLRFTSLSSVFFSNFIQER